MAGSCDDLQFVLSKELVRKSLEMRAIPPRTSPLSSSKLSNATHYEGEFRGRDNIQKKPFHGDRLPVLWEDCYEQLAATKRFKSCIKIHQIDIVLFGGNGH
ncbi:hypothetical protein GCM10009096_10940 [Parasphingorhabdus litoris]|uniref:Uncharacterized protein n=1 Tax=Parasphingorhabdus litoris TaxID=394733 RepID=A0ABN1AAM0_9SPHN